VSRGGRRGFCYARSHEEATERATTIQHTFVGSLGAHGFTGMQIDGLVEARLAASSTRTVRAGERPVEVTTVRITDAGRVLLERGS
jgi:hypothetical protein